MKMRFLALLVVIFWAQQAGVATERLASPAAAELVALEKFLSLSDAELEAMEAAIARVRAMTPEERAAFRERIVAFRTLPSVRREEIRANWGWVSKQDREDWRRMMQNISPKDRADIHARMGQVPSTERAAFKHAILEEWRAGLETSKP